MRGRTDSHGAAAGVNATQIGKLIAIVGVSAGSVQGLGNAADKIEAALNFPQRFLTMSELRILETSVVRDSLLEISATADEAWFEARLDVKPPRKAQLDRWNTEFRVTDGGGRAVTCIPDAREGFTIQSAGPDRRFGTDDDVVVAHGASGIRSTTLSESELLDTGAFMKMLPKDTNLLENVEAAAKRMVGSGESLSDTLSAELRDVLGDVKDFRTETLADSLSLGLEDVMNNITATGMGEKSEERKRYDPFARLKKALP